MAIRKRGAPKGNQNACKHGFYSGALDPAETSEFWHIINSEGLAPEIALIRVKLRSCLQQDPGNPRVIRDASNLLAKWYASKFRLSKTNHSYLRRVIHSILLRYSGASPGLPEGRDS